MNEELQNEQGDFEINLDKNFKPKKKVNMEEEAEPKPITLKTAFWGVLGVHVLALAGMGMYSTHAKAQASSIEEDRKAMSEPMPKIVGVENPVVASSTPTPAPSPSLSPKPNVVKVDNTKPKVEKVEVAKANPTPTPKPKVIEKIPQNINPNYPNPKFTKEYVVKHGDTFTKIVHRYGLNGEKLKKLNGIKDENKLVLGQKLKFL